MNAFDKLLTAYNSCMDRPLFSTMVTRAMRHVCQASGLGLEQFDVLQGSPDAVVWLVVSRGHIRHAYAANSAAWLVQLYADAGAGGFGAPLAGMRLANRRTVKAAPASPALPRRTIDVASRA